VSVGHHALVTVRVSRHELQVCAHKCGWLRFEESGAGLRTAGIEDSDPGIHMIEVGEHDSVSVSPVAGMLVLILNDNICCLFVDCYDFIMIVTAREKVMISRERLIADCRVSND
jgi:hypothetical protein